jgi:hypothetical protein
MSIDPIVQNDTCNERAIAFSVSKSIKQADDEHKEVMKIGAAASQMVLCPT